MISKNSNLYDHVRPTDGRTDGQLPSAITRSARLRATKMVQIGLNSVFNIVSFLVIAELVLPCPCNIYDDPTVARWHYW